MSNTNEDHLYAFWSAATELSIELGRRKDGTIREESVMYIIDLARSSFWPRLADRATALLKEHGIAVIPTTEADQ